MLPITLETESIVDAQALARMKPGGLLINVGRGALVDDNALMAALDQGHLAHAVLDVFREEPLPAGHPFWRHPGITVTPHLGAYIDRALGAANPGQDRWRLSAVSAWRVGGLATRVLISRRVFPNGFCRTGNASA